MALKPAFVERRTIEFSEAGVLQVVNTSPRAAGAFGLPSVPPAGVRFLPQEGNIVFGYGKGDTARWISIEAEQLGALLLAYCIRKKVPLPRRGDKGVIIKGNSVLLMFQVQHAEATAPEVAEPSNIQPASVRVWSWRSAGTQSAYGGAMDDRLPVHAPTGPAGPEPAEDP